ncbi:Hsp20/alpha crystallin family protein [Micromonospora sp. NBC_01796]|uniref:Hsp20/alpha crystallin family protein n=1 Tax=Micromonospora sp. NBC_01796 TaxID=2975987 RepID=UPI002DDC43C4|nr:Hsp20/alpha crystallin family protein [Micromonospora sp. NBC_01796]
MSQPVQAGIDRGREAVTGLRAFRAELGRMVNSALAGVGGGPPEVELVDSDDGWYVVARLPGVAPEEVALEVDGRDLCVRARSEEEVNADSGMPGAGSRVRAFEHRVRLPGEVDLDRIDAVMDHGLLTVALPKAGRSGRRTITVGRRYPSSRSTTAGTSGAATTGATTGGGSSALPAGAAARRVGEAALTAGSSARSGGGMTGSTDDPAADRELHQPEAGTSQPARRHFG